jgi:polyketide synthase 12
VTGSTGFVGAFIVRELLKQGIVVHCLARAPIIHIAVGDSTQPLFGIDELLFEVLGETIDVTCHSAGLVD